MKSIQLSKTLISIKCAQIPKFYSTTNFQQRLEFDLFENGIKSPQSHSSTSDSQNPLLDSFGRFHSYLRISLTERCNLRCTYCMPEEGVPLCPTSKLLTSDEIVKFVSVFAKLGVDKIRLTGGEPTIRKDLLQIIKEIALIPQIKQIGITSNGIILGRQLLALKEAGLNKLNISLDTLNEEKFTRITRRNAFHKVINLINLAETLFDPLKLNCVVIRGVNDDEVLNFVNLTETRNLDIRFIEFMPFGGNNFDSRKMVPYKEILANIAEKYGERIVRLSDKPNDTSKAYKVEGFRGQFGFITSMSDHFCGTCNRLRITADGNLKVCLHGNAEISLRDKLREGGSDEDLTSFIAAAVQRKKARHAGMEKLMQLPNRPMVLIDTSFEARKNLEIIVQPYNSMNFINSSILTNYYKQTLQQKLNFISNVQDIRFAAFRSFHSSISFQKTYQIPQFTHLDTKGKAKMVDISSKKPTHRIAIAKAIVHFPKDMLKRSDFFANPKGDLFCVSKIAGIQAAKRTSNLIPLCHQIPLNNVLINFQIQEDLDEIWIFCQAKAFHVTGVEMEALVGCSVAALTIYDMCKAFGRGISLNSIELIGKRGGKSDFGQVDLLSVEEYQ